MEPTPNNELKQRIASFPDEKLKQAAQNLENYNTDAQGFILEEVQKRGLQVEAPEPQTLDELERQMAKEPTSLMFTDSVENEEEVKVGYNKVFGWIMIACSSFILFVALLIGQATQLLTGGVLMALGIAYLSGSAIVVTPKEVQLKNPLGMTVRSYPYKELKLENRRIYADGKKIRVPLYSLDKKDIAKIKFTNK